MEGDDNKKSDEKKEVDEQPEDKEKKSSRSRPRNKTNVICTETIIDNSRRYFLGESTPLRIYFLT
jgi:hypothetical protein